MSKSDSLILGDCVLGMSKMAADSVDLICADPPYNIGFDYGEEYDDSMSAGDYAAWSDLWVRGVYRLLKPSGSFWLVIGDEWSADLRFICREFGFHLRNAIVWYYTFGVHCTTKFNRSHCHLLYFTKSEKGFTFNRDDIRVKSSRETTYKDTRAASKGKTPDDVWILRPDELPGSFPPEGDTWVASRVCGTYAERIPGAANQLPEQLVGRIIRASSNAGDLVFDPMAGTGTVLAVAKKLGRHYCGFEQSPKYHALAKERIGACSSGDQLAGAIPHGG